MYSTTSLQVAKDHEAAGYEYTLLPDGFWIQEQG